MLGNFKPRVYRPEYKMPGRDSARALSQATQFLVGARSLDGVTADWLAHRFNLSPKRAEYLLTIEQQRRAQRG